MADKEQFPCRKGDMVVARYRRRTWDASGKSSGEELVYRLAEVLSATRGGRAKTVRDTAKTNGRDAVGKPDSSCFDVQTVGEYARHPALVAAFEATGVAEAVELGGNEQEARTRLRELIGIE